MAYDTSIFQEILSYRIHTTHWYVTILPSFAGVIGVTPRSCTVIGIPAVIMLCCKMCKGMRMGILEFPILTSQSILRHICTALISLTPFCCSTSYKIQDINCIVLWIYKYWLIFHIQRVVTDHMRYCSELTMERPIGGRGGGYFFLKKKPVGNFFIEKKCFTCWFHSRPFCFIWNYGTKQVIGHRKINNLKVSSWLVVLDIKFRIWNFIYWISNDHSYHLTIDNIVGEFDCRFRTFIYFTTILLF